MYIYKLKPFLSRSILYLLTSNYIAYKVYTYMPFLFTNQISYFYTELINIKH